MSVDVLLMLWSPRNTVPSEYLKLVNRMLLRADAREVRIFERTMAHSTPYEAGFDALSSEFRDLVGAVGTKARE